MRLNKEQKVQECPASRDKLRNMASYQQCDWLIKIITQLIPVCGISIRCQG